MLADSFSFLATGHYKDKVLSPASPFEAVGQFSTGVYVFRFALLEHPSVCHLIAVCPLQSFCILLHCHSPPFDVRATAAD